MSADEKPAPVTVYQLKVSLSEISPMIWRRLQVTSDTTIAQLHDVVQIALGWEDSHLHRFRIHGKEYGVYRDGGIVFADDPHLVRLADFKLRKGERFVYDYDLGDLWHHDLRLEKVLPLDSCQTYPVCIAGHGACPPEDCGGPQGYLSRIDERCSLAAVLEVHDDIVLVAQRLRDFFDGGPRPTAEDEELTAALERMRERLAWKPITFSRRAVNAALRTERKETTCVSASNSSPLPTMERKTGRRSLI